MANALHQLNQSFTTNNNINEATNVNTTKINHRHHQVVQSQTNSTNELINNESPSFKLRRNYRRYLEALFKIENQALEEHNKITIEAIQQTQSKQKLRVQNHLLVDLNANIKRKEIYNEFSEWVKYLKKVVNNQKNNNVPSIKIENDYRNH